jgi:hypothetical protein
VGDQFNDRFQRGQRLGAPVDGDVGARVGVRSCSTYWYLAENGR